MSIKLQLPKVTDLKPRITVIGVGGAGGNAVNNMIASGLVGVDFIVANTDAQALQGSSAERRIQLGLNVTEGLGAGSKPEIGQAAAEEAIEEIRNQIAGSHMVFIAAGMGGGTGTGAAAVIARIARESNILTVGIVTKPFTFEGTKRMRTAEAGTAELKKYVDTLIVIPNQNLFRIANERTTFAEAFILADQVLYSGIACIVDLIVKEGLINLDFADVRTVMRDMGSAMMGTGEASGERRATRAAEEAIANPLLDEVSLKGAKGLLLSIIGGRDMTLHEVDQAASRVREEVDPEANIIVGATFDENMGDRIRVAIVASGLVQSQATRAQVGHRTAGTTEAQPVAPPMPVPPMAGPIGAPRAQDTQPMSPFQSRMPSPIADPSRGNLPPPIPGPTSSREVWQAPRGVVIEEAPQPGARGAPFPQPGHQPVREDMRADAPGFVPGPPQDFARSDRRMPNVDDFPTVGQREYRAKSGQYGEPSDKPPAAPSPRVYDQAAKGNTTKRGGFLQRITGGFGRDDDGAEDAAGTRNRDAQLPFFFNKNKR